MAQILNYWTQIFQGRCWKVSISERFTYHQQILSNLLWCIQSLIRLNHKLPTSLLDQGFSSAVDFAPQGTFGHVWRHFGLSQLDNKGRGAIGIYWIEARGPVKHPTMYMTDLNNKEYSSLHVNNAKVEKPCHRQR